MNAIVERREQPPLVKLASQLEQRATEFKKALPSHISPEKLQRTIMTAVQNSPDLLMADRQTLITSCMKAAQDGLLPDGREAALVIFSTRFKDASGQWSSKKQVQYMPMVYGLRKKIVQSGEIVSLQTGLVYRAELEAGAFIYEVGMEPPIRHRPMLDLSAEDLTDDKIVAAYSLARMKDGSVSVEVMRRGEIDRVREVSQTGATKDRFGKPRESKGPWADWFGEMARKTVMRRHSKTLPMSGDLIVDIEGQEMEAAASTVQLLDVEPDAPIALPSNDELEQRAKLQNETPHDPETGEVSNADEMERYHRNIDKLTGENPETDPATGFTELSEDEARALDAEQTYQDLDGPLEEEAELEQEEAQPEGMNDKQKAILVDIERMLANAKVLSDVRKADAEWNKHRVTFSDSTIKTMDELIYRKAQRMSKTSEAGGK